MVICCSSSHISNYLGRVSISILVSIRSKAGHCPVHGLWISVKEGIWLALGLIKLAHILFGCHIHSYRCILLLLNIQFEQFHIAKRIVDFGCQHFRFLTISYNTNTRVCEVVLRLVHTLGSSTVIVRDGWRRYVKSFGLIEDELEVAILQRGRLRRPFRVHLLAIIKHWLYIFQVLLDLFFILAERPIHSKFWSIGILRLNLPSISLSDLTILQKSLLKLIEALLTSLCLISWENWRRSLLFLIIWHHFLAFLLKEYFVLVPVLRHHMIKLVYGKIWDLLLRNASEWPGDAFCKLNRGIINCDWHRVFWIFRLTWSNFLVVLYVTSCVVHIGKTRVDAHILRLIHRLHRDFIAKILVAFEDWVISRDKLWILLLHDISSLFLLMPAMLINVH